VAAAFGERSKVFVDVVTVFFHMANVRLREVAAIVLIADVEDAIVVDGKIFQKVEFGLVVDYCLPER